MRLTLAARTATIHAMTIKIDATAGEAFELTTSIRVPRRFYDDHVWRDLPVPAALRKNARTVTIAANDPNLDEYMSDADHYATAGGFDPSYSGVESSARATVRALKTAGVWTHG